jgi:DNA-binding CsgD family transcriptional regulator
MRIVGRGAELSVLRDLVDALPSGGVVVIEGEAGLGKTTLLDVVERRAVAAGVSVVRTGADEFTAARPLGLLAAEFDASTGVTDIDELLAALESRMTGGVGVAIVLDDLQWADGASLALLAPFVRRAVPMGAAVVMSLRSWPRDRAVEELFDRLTPLDPTWIRLPAMTPDELATLAELQIGRPIGPGVATLLASTGGNPFYANSLVRILAGERLLDESSDVADVDPTALLLGQTTLASLVTRRVAALGSDTRHLLVHAAVLGRVVRVDDLAALVGMPVETVVSCLDDALRADILVRDGDHLAFRHDLVRSALEYELAPAVRRSVHRRAAAIAQQHHDAATAATHLLGADTDVSDVDALVGLAASCAPSAGLALLDRAFDALPPGDPRRRSIACRRVDLRLWTGDPAAAVESARDLLASNVDDDTAYALRTTIAHALFVLGRADEAVDSWVSFPDGTADSLRAGEFAEMAFASLFAGRLGAAAALAERARDLTDEATAVVIASIVLAWVAAASGDVVTALDHANRAVREMGDAGETARRIGPHLVRAMVHDLAGGTDLALADVRNDAEQTIDRAALIRVPFRHVTAATTHFHRGAFDDALAEAAAGMCAGADLSVRGLDGWLRTVPAMITLYRDGPGAAARTLGAAELQLGSDWWFWTCASIAAAEGRLVDAFDMFEAVASIGASVGSTGSVALVAPDLARVALRLDRCGRAATVLDLADAGSINAGPLVARLRWADALLSSDAGSVRTCAEAMAGPRPFDAAVALHDAAVLDAPEDPDAARVDARNALAVFERCGARWSAARLRADLRGHGLRLRSAGSGQRIGWGAITPTERLVVDLVVEGCTNAEIARRLVISRRTVESHLVHIYDKVGVRTRVELTALAVANGHTDDPPTNPP